MGLGRGMAGFHQVLKTSIHCFVQGTRSSILNFSNISLILLKITNQINGWLLLLEYVKRISDIVLFTSFCAISGVSRALIQI